MEINKNWFYDISWSNDDNIIVWNNINVVIFDYKDIDRQVFLWENSRLEFYWFISKSGWFNREIIVTWENSRLKLWYLL